MSEYVGYDDDMGQEFVGDDEEILGAVKRAVQQARRPALTAPQRPPTKLRGYLGLGSVTFVNAGATTGQLIVEPQRAFRPERLVIARFNVGAASPGLSCTVVNIFIGDMPQSPSQEQAAPTEMFAADATYAGIDFNVCKPGQKIQINLAISAAPAVAETVRLALGFYGDMLRGQ